MSLAYFPVNYDESRLNFLKSVNKLSGKWELTQWKVPCDSDPHLFVDSVYMPPTKDKKRLFILISGTHGLEGYAGSGIQQLFLEEYLNRVDKTETGFLVIHSLNPFGFKYHKRGTESGVNLNRNCSIHSDFFQVPNIKSIEFTNQFIPVRAVDSETSFMISQMVKRGEEVEFAGTSMDEFVKAVGLGQFHEAKGLEYGGKAVEPQIASLIDLLKKLIPQYRDVIHLDLHTGLGERARLHLLVDGQEEGLHSQLFSELFQPKHDSDIYAFTDSDAPGFYKTRGATNNLVAELIGPHQRGCALTLEFGTLGHDLKAQLESLNSWMLEHQGTWYGYANRDLEVKIKQLYLERFFPSDDLWRETILKTSREFFKRIFKRVPLF
ncbi:MAG: M14 family metallopeptidase [Pseudobdellovibrionaceae bacterium]